MDFRLVTYQRPSSANEDVEEVLRYASSPTLANKVTHHDGIRDRGDVLSLFHPHLFLLLVLLSKLACSHLCFSFPFYPCVIPYLFIYLFIITPIRMRQ